MSERLPKCRVLVAGARRRVLDIADPIGVVAVHVHATDGPDRGWYARCPAGSGTG